MTITRHLLNTEYAWWFGNKRNAEHAKEEILMLFSEEPDDLHEWSE